MRMTGKYFLHDTDFAPAVITIVRADDDEVVTRVKGYIGKLFVFFYPAGWPHLGQPACLGAGCYIKMALSYHQPHQHELVGG